MVDLDDEYADTDIPTTLIRSKADCPTMEVPASGWAAPPRRSELSEKESSSPLGVSLLGTDHTDHQRHCHQQADADPLLSQARDPQQEAEEERQR